MNDEIKMLKESLREQRGNMTESHAVRLHRALSWLRCAQEHNEEPDVQFISLWIAFNACYSVDDEQNKVLGERSIFKHFSKKLVEHDVERDIYSCLWFEFSGPVRALIKNQYVFPPFWEAQRLGLDESHWRPQFDKSAQSTANYLGNQRVPDLLCVVLDRLYVLRNQLMHGGATYQSMVNRDQVRDGCQMLSFLMPVIVKIMLDAKDEDWGDIYFPVVK